ncbi:MAG: hypothetical protein ACRC9L_08730 [Brevinema sp.]
MKSFCLSVLLLMGAVPVLSFAQDSYQLEFKDARTGLARERRVILGFDIRTGGLMALGPASPSFTTGVSALNFSITLPLINNMTLQFQARLGVPYFSAEGPIANTLPLIFQTSITTGLFLGLGGRLADWRDTKDKRGWSVWMHGGFILDYGIQNIFISPTRPFTSSESIYMFFSIGSEVNVQAVYNFSPKAAVSLGIYADFRVSPFAGDPFYIAYENLVASFIMIGWGFSLGFLF